MYVALVVARLVGLTVLRSGAVSAAQPVSPVEVLERARLGPRVACSSRAPASASRITRSTLPPASWARSASRPAAVGQRGEQPRVAADVLEARRGRTSVPS